MTGMRCGIPKWLAAGALLACVSCAAREAPPQAPGAQTVTVRAHWGARTASSVAEEVAAPLEAELAKIPGVVRIVSYCDRQGCSISLQHSGGARGDDLAFLASSAVMRVKPKLPRGAHAMVYTSDLNRRPDIALALVLNAKRTKAEHYAVALDYANTLMQLPSAVRYELPGAPEEEVRVEVDPARAKKWGVSVSEITNAIEKHMLVVDQYTRIIVAPRPPRRGGVGDIVLKQVGKTSVRVRDAARVTKVMTPAQVHRVDGEPAVLIHLYLQSGASPAEVRTCLDRILKKPRPPIVQRVVVISARVR